MGPLFALGFQARKAFKDLEKNEWQKAEESIQKTFEKDSLDPAAFHAYSVLLSDSRAPQFNIDEASIYNHLATKWWNQQDEKGIERLQKMGINNEQLRKRREIIDSIAFILALQRGTEESFNHFIDLFPEAKQKEKAIESRNRIAFEKADNENSINAYRTFLDKYPLSTESAKAKEKLDKLIYEEQGKNADLNQMVSFLRENPESPYRSEVEFRVFKQMTGYFTSENLNRFIALFPDSHYSGIAYDFLFHIEKESMDTEHFLQKYSLFPNADSLRNLQSKEEGFLIPVLQDKKIGYVNNHGESVLSSAFPDTDNQLKCKLITSDIISVSNADSIFLYNRNGKLILNTEADSISDLGDGFLRVSNQGKQGLIHKSGFVFFQPEYRGIEPISGSIFMFRKGASWGIMNAFQKILLNDEYTSIRYLQGNILLEKNGREGIYPLKKIIESDAKTVWEFPYEDIEELGEEFYLCSIDDSEALLDHNLNVIIPLQNQQVIQVGDNWLAVRDSSSIFFSSRGNNLINKIESYILNGDNIAYKLKGKWFIYPKETSYDSIKFLSNQVYITITANRATAHFSGKTTLDLSNSSSIQWISSAYENDFSGFFLSMDKDKVKRLYDSSGKKILAGWFDEVTPLSGFLFQIEEKKLKGLSDSTGRSVLPINYDGIGKYVNGNVSLLKKGKFGLFNYPNRIIIEPEYEKQLKPFGDSLFVAVKNKKSGLIDLQNKIILPFEYDELEFWSPAHVLARTGNERWIISLTDDVSVPLRDYRAVIDPNGRVARIFETSDGYGVFDPGKGNIIPPVFTDLNYLRLSNDMVYVAGQYLIPTDLWIIAYFDVEGKLIWRSSVSKEDYSQYLCK